MNDNAAELKTSAERRREGGAMPGQIVHIEIPADDTAKGEFWGSLFGWQFEAYPGEGPSEYHMTRIGDQMGAAISNMEPGKKGTRAYFDVEDIKAGAARVKELGGEADDPMPVVLDVQGPAGERVRPLAERPVRPGTDRVDVIDNAAASALGRRQPSRARAVKSLPDRAAGGPPTLAQA
jgi:predicted enzyme related to lactoylglutathione lyase